MCSMATGFSIAAAAATTTNSRFFTPPRIRLRRTTPLISPLHTSPLSLFHRKKLPPHVASTTNVETEHFDAQRDFWYAVTLIKDLDPNTRTSFTIALYGRITVIQLLKENGQWIAFKENSVHCPFRWPVQGCSRCSSRSSDGRAAQSPRACATRFPTMESEGVLYVRQRVRFTQLPSDKPIDTMPEVPANDHREDSPNEKSTTPCSPCRTTSSDLKSTKEDSMNEKLTDAVVPRQFVSPIVKGGGALQFFVENMAEYLKQDLINEKSTFEFPVKEDPVNEKSTIDAPKPLVIGGLQFLCLGALHLLFRNKEMIIPLFQELCQKIINLFADFLKEYFKKTLKSWSENILSTLIKKYLVKPVLVALFLFAVKEISKKNDYETTTK